VANGLALGENGQESTAELHYLVWTDGVVLFDATCERATLALKLDALNIVQSISFKQYSSQ
jgi:hypothetical protein